MVEVIQADREAAADILATIPGAKILPINIRIGLLDDGRAVKVAVNHRIAAEKAVLANGVNCSSCGVRLPKDYEKPCPDCGALDIDTTALADAIGADHGQ